MQRKCTISEAKIDALKNGRIQSMINGLFLRLFLLVPWIFLVWLIGQGIAGEISALLVFVLLFILIPAAIVVNLITVVAFQGHQALKMIRNLQKSKDVGNQKLESTNYSELPWWDPRRWR